MPNARKNSQLRNNKPDSSSQTPSWIFKEIQRMYEEFEKLTDLKEERVRNSKRKKSEVDNSEEPISKQPKIGDVIAPPYGPEHPRQQALTNAIAQMICVDAMPVSTVYRFVSSTDIGAYKSI